MRREVTHKRLHVIKWRNRGKTRTLVSLLIMYERSHHLPYSSLAVLTKIFSFILASLFLYLSSFQSFLPLVVNFFHFYFLIILFFPVSSILLPLFHASFYFFLPLSCNFFFFSSISHFHSFFQLYRNASLPVF